MGLLRGETLEEAYAAAWSESEAGEEAALWETTAADGIDNEA